MLSMSALHIFQEPRPVTVSWDSEIGERFCFHGVALITELPFLRLQFPKTSTFDVKKVKQNTHVFVDFEIDHSYLLLYTRVVKILNQIDFLVRVEQIEQSKQKRVVSRVPAYGIHVNYLPVDEQGLPLRQEKKRAEAVNISKTGVLLRMNEIFEPNQRLQIDLRLSDLFLCHCFGRVVRLAMRKTGVIESAIHFEDMSNDNRTMLSDHLTKISE